jgi:dTDP-4-dehydrorhamnose reductase
VSAEHTRPILLFGAGGQLGVALEPKLAQLGAVVAVTHADVDFERTAELEAYVARLRPRLVVNAAAYTAVDAAESDLSRCMAVNASAPAILAEATARLDVPLVHYSTNYVFDGLKSTAYAEDDPPAPRSVYAATKLEGERLIAAANPRHLILRTSALYARHGRNFVCRMLSLSRERDELRVVDDQFVSPTPAWLVADVTAAALQFFDRPGSPWGVFHLTTTGSVSWHAFAERILELDPDRAAQRARSVVPMRTAEYPTPARRPPNGVLDVTKLERTFGVVLPSWDAALRATLVEGER